MSEPIDVEFTDSKTNINAKITLHGVDIRDLFAAVAMAGYSANPNWNDATHELIALMAYDAADEMWCEKKRRERECQST